MSPINVCARLLARLRAGSPVLAAILACTPPATAPTSPAAAPRDTTAPAVATDRLPELDTARVDAIRVAWTAASGAQTPTWIAHDRGIFAEYGLNVDLLYIASSTTAVQALLADEIQFSTCAGGAVVASRVAGSDATIIAGLVNVPAFYLMARPGLPTVEALRGQRIAIDRRGSSQEVAGRLVLRARGLDPDRDVLWVSVGGGFLEVLASLESGAADAAVLSSPTNLEARKRGYVELVDVASQGLPYQGSCVMVRDSYVSAHPDVVRKVIRAYADAIHRYKTDEDFSLRVLKQYTKIDDDEIQRETWRYYAGHAVSEVPYPSLPGIQTVIEEVAATNPAAANHRPEEFVDDRFVAELDCAGYFGHLYGR
jgi:ABC-type nitrate/sulfonate/bicarbonate transport system substrate-binding protein